jgi:hypothetical protein
MLKLARLASGCALTAMVSCTTTPPSNQATHPPRTTTIKSNANAADAPTFTDEETRDVCATVIRKTRQCKELYLPALLRTRAKYDKPPGIAARYDADGEEKLLLIASEEFDRDFSEDGVEKRCGEMMAEPKATRDEIVAREQSCLPSADNCSEFVACNMALLEAKWSPNADSPPESD